MESIAINGTENQNNQHLHVANVNGEDDRHHHSTLDEEQIMQMTDITDLTQDGIVSIPKELILISLVSQEQALYNPKHENYRNTQRKDIKWMEIADHVGWSEIQCKAKWKAMRDQYCRELKRSKFNMKANVKWKYFKELDFLRPYALARNYRPRNTSTTNQLSSSGTMFSCTPTTTSISGNMTVSETNTAKYATIKLESNAQNAFDDCDFVSNKTEATTLTEDQINSVLQHQQQHHQHQQTDDNNWSYLTGSTNSSNNNPTTLDNHNLSESHLLSNNSQQQTTDEALYNALVDCVGQIQQQQQQQLCESTNNIKNQQTTISSQSPPDEEDDDPIHTFLNIESYFEKELILLIQHEDVLYNSYHPNYRNVKLKMEVWDEIARKLKKTVKQCRLKWKALRDQFIREHKRLKHRENVETLPRWKHYDALSFLQKFIKLKTSDFELTKSSLLPIPKTEVNTVDIDEDDDQINMSVGSPLRSPLDNVKCEMHPTTAQSTTHQQQQQLQQIATLSSHHHQHSNHSDNLCVSTGSVEGYDDMDIDNYIIGDGGSVIDDSQSGKTEDHHPDSMDEHKSQHEYDVHLYSNGQTTTNHTNINDLHQLHHNRHSSTNCLESKTSSHSSPEQQQQQQQQLITMRNTNLNNNTLIPANVPSSTYLSNNEMHVITSNNNNSNPDTKPTTTFGNDEDLLMATAAKASKTTEVSSVNPLNCLQIKANVQTTESSTPATPSKSRNTLEAFTNTTPSTSPLHHQQQTHPQQQLQQNMLRSNNHGVVGLTEDDEVGVFFKAIAMKIRNAKMSPVAFTDLQIDILRVINCSLRNH